MSQSTKMIAISEVARIVTGKTPSTKESLLWNGDTPFVTPGDLQFLKNIINTGRTVSDTACVKMAKQLLPARTICVSCIGNLGYVGMTTKRSLSNQQINSLIPNNEKDAEYLYYAMKNLWQFFKKLEGQSTTLSILNKSQFSRICIPWPDEITRKQIGQTLSLIDSKIELNTQINGYLEELLLAKYDKLFPVNADFTGILSDVGTVIGGATPSKKRSEYYCSNGIGWITPRDLSNTSDKFIAHGADDITDEGYASCSAKLLPKGSVLFSSRAPIGYIAIATDAVATNQGFKSIVPKEEIGTAFVYCFLVRNKQRIADMGAGTTFPEVSGKMMKSVELAVPEQTLCAEFDFFAGPILKQQEALERENRELAALRDALLPKLMSGEINVSQVDLTQLNSHLA